MIFLVFFLFVSCDEDNSLEPQILTFNYRLFSVEDGDMTVNNIQNGNTTVSSLLRNDPCNFTLNFNPVVGIPPTKSVSGTPGQRGFNLRLNTTNAIHINPNANPITCEIIKEIIIQVGKLSETISLGIPTEIGEFSLIFIGTDEHTDLEYFSATVNTFNQESKRATGTFSVLKRNRLVNRNRILAVEGSFAFND